MYRATNRPGIDVWRPVTRAGSLLSRNLLTALWIILGELFGLCLPILAKIPLEIEDGFYVKTSFSHVLSDIASF